VPQKVIFQQLIEVLAGACNVREHVYWELFKYKFPQWRKQQVVVHLIAITSVKQCHVSGNWLIGLPVCKLINLLKGLGLVGLGDGWEQYIMWRDIVLI